MGKKQVEAWPGLVGILLFDVQDGISRLESDGSDTNRRGLVRTLIAAVEGLTWIYREHVTGIAETMEALTDQERQVLAEAAYFVSEDGKISMQRRSISVTAMIRFITRIAARAAPGNEPDFGDEGWANLKQTFEIRNRITHPKVEADLEISSDDVSRALSAFFWFSELVIGTMARTTDTLRIYSNSVLEVIRLLQSGDEAALELYRRLEREE